MVNPRHRVSHQRGALITEILVAMAIFALALVPLGVTVMKEHRLARLLYNRAVAGEILDGELEILLAGEWRNLAPGTHPLSIVGTGAESLPPGTFEVTLDERQVRLVWRADKPLIGGHFAREASLPSP